MSEINTNKTEVKETNEKSEKAENKVDASLENDLNKAHKNKLDGDPTNKLDGASNKQEQKLDQNSDDKVKKTGENGETDDGTSEHDKKNTPWYTKAILGFSLFAAPFYTGNEKPDVHIDTTEASHVYQMENTDDQSVTLDLDNYTLDGSQAEELVENKTEGKDAEEKSEPTFIDELNKQTDVYKIMEDKKGPSHIEAKMGDPEDIKTVEPLTFQEGVKKLLDITGEMLDAYFDENERQEKEKEKEKNME